MFGGMHLVDQNTRHFVRSVREGGPAAAEGTLQAGDELLEVSSACSAKFPRNL